MKARVQCQTINTVQQRETRLMETKEELVAKLEMERPTKCPHCGDHVSYVNNEKIYGRPYGRWPFAYRCDSFTCDSYVGVHPNTEKALGTLANRPMREARKEHKPKFFALLEKKGWGRNKGYKWLAEAMGLPRQKTHWGMFDVEQCELAGRLCVEAMNNE